MITERNETEKMYVIREKNELFVIARRAHILMSKTFRMNRRRHLEIHFELRLELRLDLLH